MTGAEQSKRKYRKILKHSKRKACRKRITNNLTADKIEDILLTYDPNYNVYEGCATNTMDMIQLRSQQYKRYIRSRTFSQKKINKKLNRDSKNKVNNQILKYDTYI